MQVVKRSVEQKIAEQKFWWGPLPALSAITKRSVEQKMVEQKMAEQKMAEQNLVETLRDPKCN